MKTLLIGLGCLSVVAGLGMFGYTLASVPYGVEGAYTSYGIIATLYLIGGFAGGIIPWGIAEVIGRLEQLERKATP